MTYDISGSGFEDATSEMQLQLGGEEREEMLDIQIGSEQEEKTREEERRFEKIVDINITSNAEEKFAGASLSSAEDFKFDMTL